jgi:thioredoxin reductase
MDTLRYDVAIVGGGAAGLTGALVLGRARRRVVVIDAGAPRNAPAAHMHGFLSRDGMPPAELLAVGRAELRDYGVDFLADEVVAADIGFRLTLKGGPSLTARRLLVATGAVDRLPDIPGVRERWGKDFLHCPYCHGWEVRDRPIGVLGSDAASVEYAHLLRQWSDDVVFFSHSYTIQGDERALLEARGIGVVEGTVGRLQVADDRLAAIDLTDGRSVPRAALFMRPTLEARSRGLLAALGCETDEHGFARVDGSGQSTVAGVWVAGNAANPRAQVITAAGEGSAAAIAINADLVREDIRDTSARREPI